MCPSTNQVTAGPQTTTAAPTTDNSASVAAPDQVTGPQTITTAPTTDDSASVAAPDLKDKDPVIVGAHGLKVL